MSRRAARFTSHPEINVLIGRCAMAMSAVCCTVPALAATALPVQGPLIAPVVDRSAFWVDSTVCSVVLKTSVDASKPLAPGTPIDQLSSLGAICISNITGQNQVAGGVRSLLAEGFRVTALSHHVAVLAPAAADGRSELLISALFSLERPQRAAATR